MKNNFNLDILCNPYTHNKLESAIIGKDVFLIDNKNGEKFLIQDDIPIFINSCDISGTNRDSTDFYNSFAPFYELEQKFFYLFFGGEKKARNDYLKYVDIKEGDKVLEVSVGTGANIRFLPEKVQYFGLDISLSQLKQCKKNNEKYGLDIQLFLGNAEYLPFDDETFDVVYHVGGINFFNNKKQAIEEMIRVAKRGTKILIADETEKVARFCEKIPYFRGPFKNRKDTISPPIDLLPQNVSNIKVTEVRKGLLYCLEFIKN